MEQNNKQCNFQTNLSHIDFVLVFSCNRSRVREDGGTITIRVFVHYVNGLELQKIYKIKLIWHVIVALRGEVDLKCKWRGIRAK